MPYIDQLSLQITNNLNDNAAIVLLGGNFNPNNQENAKNYYQFDLRTETFINTSTVKLNYFVNGSATPFSRQNALPNGSVASVVDVLNSFSLGLWFYNGTIIYTYSKMYAFASIVIA